MMIVYLLQYEIKRMYRKVLYGANMDNDNKIQNKYIMKPEISSATSLTYSNDGSVSRTESQIIHEHIINLYINDNLYARTTCTADNLAELVVGKLICERMIENYEDIDCIDVSNDGGRANIYLNNDITMSAGIMLEPTCCTSNRVYFDSGVRDYLKFDDELSSRCHKIEPETVFKIIDAFQKGSHIHRNTNGTHSAYLAYKNDVVFSCEDIGRHNAIDKVIGYAAINKLDFSKCIIFTSGRVPMDMVQKVIFARIPILISKSVVTDEALNLAKDCGLTLICKAWPDKYELYA